jgi:hypothetical protein|tara:strand:- start:28 stop:504 length:477 start_codon:yes stop_codon:yes gene_type:complete
MSEIRVNKIQGTSGTDTAITLSGANATIGGTLAVTGVHTIGTNAVATSDGGGATTSIVQGLAKMWFYKVTDGSSLADSFNASSVTDTGTGDFSVVFSNNMNNANYGTGKGSTVAYDGQTSASGEQLAGIEATSLRIKMYQNGGISDAVCLGSIHGDLA